MHRHHPGAEAEIAGVFDRMILQIFQVDHALIAALAQTGIFIAQVVVDHRDAFASTVGKLADGMLRRINVVNPHAGNRAGIGIFGTLHPRCGANQRGQFRQL